MIIDAVGAILLLPLEYFDDKKDISGKNNYCYNISIRI